MQELPLPGCSPTPLVNYLKALGLLRILSEQAPQFDVRGGWRDEQFVLYGEIDRDAITQFLLRRYQPSPIVAPWNGGSGFHPNDNRDAIKAICAGKSERFTRFREVVAAATSALGQLGLKEKPSPELKEPLLKICRNTFPDNALAWIDAAFVLTRDGVRYPPLLGTGGNDGRLDFTNNYMQRIADVIDPASGDPQEGAEALLGNALFGDVANGLSDNAIGQFGPAAAGGANASSGFTAKALVNPWDFVLMLEGAVLFAAASVKRLGANRGGQLAYPFAVRTTGVGYGSASGADETDSRCEMWMPLWPAPASCLEVRSLLGEGRAQIGMRPVSDGLDFYRAISCLGVDRGISAFQRYGFLVRNGLAYFATPLERVAVRRNSVASELLSDLDRDNWLDRFRRKAFAANSPQSVARSCRRLERSIIGLCVASQEPRSSALQVRELIVALGRCELAMAHSLAWTKDSGLRPIPPLSPLWLSSASQADDSAMVEYRLAAGLASLTLNGYFGEHSHAFRTHLEPVEFCGPREHRWVRWLNQESRDIIGLEGRLIERMNAVIHRRILLCRATGRKGWQEFSVLTAHLSDIAAFIEGACDEGLLRDFAIGLSLINWADPEIKNHRPSAPLDDIRPDAFYALIKLCHAKSATEVEALVLDGSIHRLAASGNAERATEMAIRTLRSSGITRTLSELKGMIGPTERAAAAILFPLWPDQLQKIREIIHAQSPEQRNPSSTLNQPVGSL